MARPYLNWMLIVGFMTVLLAAPASWAAGPYKTFTVPPCRPVDTRLTQGEIAAFGTRCFSVRGDLDSQGGAFSCGVPDSAKGVYVNVVAISPSAAGHLTVRAACDPVIGPASTLNFLPGQTIANGVLVPICESGPFDICVTMGPASSNIVVDVNGFLVPKP